MQEQLTQLRALAFRYAQGRHVQTAVPRVVIATGREPTGMMTGVCEAMVCVVLQGAKEITIGDKVLRYDQASYFIASIELPASGRVIEASPDLPYVSVGLALDWQSLASLMPEMPPVPAGQGTAFGVSPVTPELLDPWLRLLRLLDTPRDIPVLAPLAEREILYRLMMGPQGGVLRQIALASGRLSQIRQAVGWIRQNFDQPLRVEDLAGLAGMSPASFHRHFKEAAAMSPLQYQKTLRLQEARRLLVGDYDAARAAFAVGYESASQFSREYARMFGAPPARDAIRLRQEAATGAEIANAA